MRGTISTRFDCRCARHKRWPPGVARGQRAEGRGKSFGGDQVADGEIGT